jgi:xylulokinase
MISQTYLGIDLGTSELKVVLMSHNGRVLESASSRLSLTQPAPGWSEQDPSQWIEALQLACADLKRLAPVHFAQVAGIGLSGQMHGATLLDANGLVLRPCILWNDSRSSEQCAELQTLCPDLQEITGNIAMPGFTAPKLLWVQKNEPRLFAKIAKVLLPKDYLRYVLTGDYSSDMSDAAGTLWLDVGKRAWSETILEKCSLTLGHMPRLVEGTEVAGSLRQDWAVQLGLRVGIPVAGSAGDNAASAVGMGVIETGAGFLSLGTSGVIFVVTDQHRPNPQNAVHAFCHAVPEKWHQMAVTLSAASALSWVATLTNSPDVSTLVAKVEGLSEAEKKQCPIFLPYLSGERTPHNDPDASGVFLGMRHAHTAAHLGFSVMEGVAFSLLDGLNALRSAGSSVQELLLVGGGARSDFWAQLISDTLNVRINIAASANVGAALGAARLAQFAVEGCNPQNMERICKTPDTSRSFTPSVQGMASINGRYNAYKDAYRSLKRSFADLQKLAH